MKLMNRGVLQEREETERVTKSPSPSTRTSTPEQNNAMPQFGTDKPFLGLLQSGWRVSRDQKEGSHGMHTTESYVGG